MPIFYGDFLTVFETFEPNIDGVPNNIRLERQFRLRKATKKTMLVARIAVHSDSLNRLRYLHFGFYLIDDQGQPRGATGQDKSNLDAWLSPSLLRQLNLLMAGKPAYSESKIQVVSPSILDRPKSK